MVSRKLKIVIHLAVLLTVASASSQCIHNVSSILDQVTANGLQSLNSLHDYVWVLEEHTIVRDKKGKIKTYDQRQQTVVANGQMHSRTLQPGEQPSLPEPEAPLSSDYRVLPALYGKCGNLPCGSYPYAFAQMIYLRDLWEVRQVQEVELNGARVLMLDLRAKNSVHNGYIPNSGTAWVDPERCRLLRLITVSAKANGHDKQEEVVEFGEVKGNWLPIKRENHGISSGKSVEVIEKYIYLRFGSSARIAP